MFNSILIQQTFALSYTPLATNMPLFCGHNRLSGSYRPILTVAVSIGLVIDRVLGIRCSPL